MRRIDPGRHEGNALKIGGLIAIVLAGALFQYLSSEVPRDLWTTLATKYSSNSESFTLFVALGAAMVNLFICGALAIVAGTRKLSLASTRTRKGLGVMCAGGNALALGLLAGNLVSGGRDDVLVEWSDAPAVMAYVLVAVGVLLVRTGWKYDVARGADVVASDPRPPVVFLRSFRDDVKSPVGGAFGVWLKVLMWFFPASFEQELAAIMNRVGPFVAVGRPGERLPELGANRFYFDDTEWQARVAELVGRARLTVILCATTASLQWEIDHVLTFAEPCRVVLLVLERGKRTRDVEEELERRLGCPGALQAVAHRRPSLVARLLFGRGRTVGKIVCFTDRWRPVVVPVAWMQGLKASFKMLARPMSPYGGALESAFEIVFQQLEVPWTPPGPNKSIAIVLAVGLGVLGLHHFYLGDRRTGLKYLAFFWTFVPAVLGLRDAVRLVLLEQTEFESRYGRADHAHTSAGVTIGAGSSD